MFEAWVFYILGTILLLSGVLVITARNPVHGVLFLVLAFFCVAGIYVILSAEFLAAVQILVYAGGILVLFLFVIMLVPLEPEGMRKPVRTARNVAWSLLSALLVAGVLMTFFRGAQPVGQGGTVDTLVAYGGNIEAVGMELYRRYLLPFEIASILLLVAMIGAVVLARRQV